MNSEIHVEGSTVCSGNFFIIVQDLDEEGTFGHILSTSKLGTRKDKQKLHFYISGENLNVYPGKSQGVCGQYVISRAQISEGPPNCHQRTSNN